MKSWNMPAMSIDGIVLTRLWAGETPALTTAFGVWCKKHTSEMERLCSPAFWKEDKNLR